MATDIVTMSKDQITELRATEARRGLTAIEVIRLFYQSDLPIQLTEEEEKIRQRFLVVQAQRLKGATTPQIIQKLQKDFGVSERQCYYDLKNALALFGDLSRVEKDAVRAMAYEQALKVYRRAMKADDLREANRAIKNMIQVYGLDREDPDIPDFEKLNPSLYVTVLDDQIRDMLMRLLKNPSVDLAKFMDQITEDAQIVPDDQPTDHKGDRPAT